MNRPLDIAFWNYDRTRPLMDGSIAIDGVNARYHTARIVPEIFEAMLRDRAYDVSELGMTYFLRAIDDGTPPPLLALPVFPCRVFRHSAIYINKASGIRKPEDLNGKTIGEVAVYGHDAGVMARGVLMDEFGFRPETCRWIIGAIDIPMKPLDFTPNRHPENVDVTIAPPEADLGKMLEDGEIDALISANLPRCVRDGSSKVGRLFEDYETLERDYYRRTGIFPIMHAVVVTRELADNDPAAVKAIYRGFCDAKDAAIQQLSAGMTFNNLSTSVPWLMQLLTENLSLLGSDWWPYGVEANRRSIDAVLRYNHEQGLSRRRFAAEDIIVPYLLDT